MEQGKVQELLSSSILEKTEELAQEMLDSLMVHFENELSKEEARDNALKTFSHLVSIVGKGLIDDKVWDKAETWGEEVGYISVQTGGDLGGTIKSTTLYKDVITTFILTKAEEMKLPATSLIEVISRVDRIITITTYGFTNAFIKHAEELIKESQSQYLKISVPIVPISNNIAILPLIGEIDEVRSGVLIEEALSVSVKQRYAHLILDVSGVYMATPLVIETLQKLVKSLKLLGVSPLVTGIRTELSKSFVESGVRLDEIPIYTNLKQAIDHLTH
ncbi:STAS domain-containing protein [Bacillus sp. ISL-47]|uniref:STAS domain-containing protein n=1 Tax=Bacillus sp. ISL-47 TaxID=2819130 RepID=UPI001BEAEB58|nr:STAS domain-containing protein [Bacillus sp. ISL-47]MBT2690722.1 STAS domain-containing protein [Bacillus sp. ISL-47]MBT2709667.1 STAS domain-containing protein [Pseudomonas sp. ISL-84]